MASLVCFSHPQYKGVEAPVLSCKSCCAIFVAAVKQQAESAAVKGKDVNQWFREKNAEREVKIDRLSDPMTARKQNTFAPGFVPELI